MEPDQFELYLIRHGLAAERGEAYPDDSKRPLTSRGIQRLKREAKALNALDVSFDVILTSPFVRTRQTAEDRKSTRLNSSHQIISYAVFCLKKKNTQNHTVPVFNTN